MCDDIRKQVIDIITEVWDRDAQITESADKIIEIVSSARGNADEMRGALEWYSAQAKRMGNAAIRQDSQAMLALMKEIAVDYGGRARKALNSRFDATGSQS